ncbi:hypothetical protein FA13DRAFT_1719870 [Coprinellus micaceus]|uniref:F-box domain-containing protein n=1 Tax=Coprinellus micaceus TaxID=71717 RepID=A0A4Y7SAI2_COPMI|nr:hypothetical protein FA13DRAFT_1719870 [Coprinellus micaceus]
MSTPILDIISSLSLFLLGHALRNQLYSCSKSQLFPSMPGKLVVAPPLDQPRIPVELIEDIVDNAADSKASLRSISGASKLLAMRARPFLFRNIDILCFRHLSEFSSLLSSRHCTIPTTVDRLVLRFETPRPGKKLAYDSESATLDLAEVLGHFEGVKDMVWLDLPMVVSRHLDWAYLHCYSNLKMLVLCGTFDWLPGLVTLLHHLRVLESLVIEAHFICDSSVENYQNRDCLSPRLKEIVLTPSTLRILRWMCGLRICPQDLHVLRISVDSRRSSLLFLNHLNDFLKKYQKISHLYVWFQDDDQDIVKVLGEALQYTPQLSQLELLFPGPLDEEEMEHRMGIVREHVWPTTEKGSMVNSASPIFKWNETAVPRNTQGLVTRPTITCHLGCHRDRGIPPNSEPCQQFSFGSNNHRASTVHSQLPCGLDGGTVKYSGSKASAKYGIGYWDAQLPMTSGTLAASATQLLPDSILHCPGEFCPFIVANLNARKWVESLGRYPSFKERANLKIGTARTAKADTSSQCLELRSVEQGRWAPSKWWKSRRKPTQGTAELSGRWIDRHGLIVSCKIDSFRGLPPTTMVAALPPYIIKDPYLTHLKVHLAQAQFIQSLQSVIGVAEVGAVGKLRGSALGLAR